MLCDLLRLELVSPVHISHFRSDADNRIEAEKVVPKPEVYKARNEREQNAQREAGIKRKLKEWRYYTHGEENEAEHLKKGKKRLHQDLETGRLEKRQRLYSPLSQDVIGTTEEVYQPMRGEAHYLDVRNMETSHERAGQLTSSRTISSFGSIMPSLPS